MITYAVTEDDVVCFQTLSYAREVAKEWLAEDSDLDSVELWKASDYDAEDFDEGYYWPYEIVRRE